MPEMISLLQKLISLIEEDTIISGCRYFQPALFNKYQLMGLGFQCSLLQSTGLIP